MIFRIATIALLTHISLTPEVYANSSAHTSSSISNRIAEREAKLEAQYFELFNTEDLTYLENDPICKTFRTQEKMAYTKEQIQKQIEKDEIEDRILNACKENTWDKISNTVGHIVEAGKEAVLLENMTDSAVERATHWALSQNAYEILMYPDLDQILKTKCYSGNDYLIPYFKAELIKNDIAPSLVGTTGGLIAGWYILKGAGKVVFAPAKSVMVARGATAETFNKLKKVSYTLVAPLLGLVAYQTISAKKNESDLARVEQNTEQLMSRIGLEAIFPEPTVQLAAEECRMAYNAIQDAPSISLRRFWTQSAQNKCKLFESHATYALKSLEGDDYNRCHPGNRGAKERIEKLMIEISNLYNN